VAKNLKALLAANNRDLAHLPLPVLRKLAPHFRQAERELEADLRTWLRKLNGEDTFTAQQLRGALLQTKEALKTLEAIRPQLVHGLKQGALSAAPLASQHLYEELNRFSARFGEVTSVPILPATKILTKTRLDQYAKLGSRWSASARETIRRDLTVGMLKQENMSQLTNRLLGKYRSRYDGATELEDKAEGIAARYVEMSEFEASRIVRTEVLDAYNSSKLEGLLDLAQEDDEIKKRWDASEDGRMCEDCGGMDGETQDPDDEFSSGDMQPPLHPQCRCSVIAYKEDWKELDKDSGGSGVEEDKDTGEDTGP